mmetsp:Transcript_118160/g.329512  ORF Transcript_118160/g.329512 Transcript_118160/m.329512 type:complete len:279 (+) Transcript_118160:198-1034(+)
MWPHESSGSSDHQNEDQHSQHSPPLLPQEAGAGKPRRSRRARLLRPPAYLLTVIAGVEVAHLPRPLHLSRRSIHRTEPPPGGRAENAGAVCADQDGPGHCAAKLPSPADLAAPCCQRQEPTALPSAEDCLPVRVRGQEEASARPSLLVHPLPFPRRGRDGMQPTVTGYHEEARAVWADNGPKGRGPAQLARPPLLPGGDGNGMQAAVARTEVSGSAVRRHGAGAGHERNAVTQVACPLPIARCSGHRRQSPIRVRKNEHETIWAQRERPFAGCNLLVS